MTLGDGPRPSNTGRRPPSASTSSARSRLAAANAEYKPFGGRSPSRTLDGCGSRSAESRISRRAEAVQARRLGDRADPLRGEPRRVEPAEATAICAAFRRKCEVVGVFVNPELDEVAKAVEDAALTIVQLNGEEGPSFCAEVARRTGVKVIKAIHVSSAADIHAAEAFRTDFHLFDRRAGGLWGGTGESFDWGLLRERRSERAGDPRRRPAPRERRRGDRRHPSLRGRRRQRRRGRARAARTTPRWRPSSRPRKAASVTGIA